MTHHHPHPSPAAHQRGSVPQSARPSEPAEPGAGLSVDPPAGPPGRKPRSNADYRWTKYKAAAFLHALATCGEVAAAARSVGMSRQSAYRLRRRWAAQGDAGFVRAWDAALWLGHAQRNGFVPPEGSRLRTPSGGTARLQGR